MRNIITAAVREHWCRAPFSVMLWDLKDDIFRDTDQTLRPAQFNYNVYSVRISILFHFDSCHVSVCWQGYFPDFGVNQSCNLLL